MRRNTVFAGLLLVAAATATGWIWNGDSSRADGETHVPDLARGEQIYAHACAACHGADLEGQPGWRSRGPDGRLPAPPHDETGHTWHHPDRILLDITLRGTSAVVGGDYKSNMPGFADTYSEAELRDVLAWIRSQWPERERAHQAEVTRRDQEAE